MFFGFVVGSFLPSLMLGFLPYALVSPPAAPAGASSPSFRSRSRSSSFFSVFALLSACFSSVCKGNQKEEREGQRRTTKQNEHWLETLQASAYFCIFASPCISKACIDRASA